VALATLRRTTLRTATGAVVSVAGTSAAAVASSSAVATITVATIALTIVNCTETVDALHQRLLVSFTEHSVTCLVLSASEAPL